MTVSRTPYTGKHSADPISQKTNRTESYKAKGDNKAPFSEPGGSLKRKGKAEITPYDGKG